MFEKRIYNFSPGPGALPLTVLEKAKSDLLNFQGQGMSILEISHRSEAFAEVVHKAREGLRSLLSIPDEFEILFLQGGATLQFYMIPLNLLLPGKPADIIHTGHWSQKAIDELQKFKGSFRVVASGEESNFHCLPKIREEDFNAEASYVYLVSNETIYGTEWFTFPNTKGVPLVADMTSDLLSRPIDFTKFGLVFASAQKNAGIAGATVVIIRKDLAERCTECASAFLQYRTHLKSRSLYNTPPTFAIYMISLMVDWYKEEGGIKAIEKRSLAKSKLLYDLIDLDDFYRNPVRKEDRSHVNVVFRIGEGEELLENLFVREALSEGFAGVKGHRLAGGIRISLYNAVNLEAVSALADFMEYFKKRYAKDRHI